MFNELLWTARAFWIGIIDIEGTSPYRFGSALYSTDEGWFSHCGYIEGRRLRRMFYKRRVP